MWLSGVQRGDVADDASEASRPGGWRTLTPALESLIDVSGLDRDLFTAATEHEAAGAGNANAKDVEQWIGTLGERATRSLLVRVAGGDPSVGAELTPVPCRPEPSSTATTAGSWF